jgi:tetratricopeptide (TPR) repeat protein
MAADFTKEDQELETLFRKYENAPDSYVFAPLADAYRKSGMLEEALEICKKGLRKHPRYPSGKVVLGKCYFDLGEVDEAQSSFEEVLGLDAQNLVALKYLGMIQAGRGDLDAARGHFKRILALDPDNREITSMLEDLQVAEDTGMTPPRRSFKDGDFEGDPISLGDDDGASDELATTTLADIYAAQGYKDKAARIYKEVLQRQPTNEAIKKKLSDMEGGVPTDESPGSPSERFEEMPVDKGDPVISEPASETGRAELDDTLKTEALEHEATRVVDEPKRKAAKKDTSEQPETGANKPLDDQKSYDQFKRWLENMNG